MTANGEADLNLSLMPKLGWVEDFNPSKLRHKSRFLIFSTRTALIYIVDGGNFDLAFKRDKCFVYSAVYP